MTDLFSNINSKKSNYNSDDIEILEGLEPVRRRPGMYIGGTDEQSLHHLVTEVLDNSIDEAVAGYATFIELEFKDNNTIRISDNGRGIPIAPHPKHPQKSALEIIMTTLHAGGKFSDKSYTTSGGLHGVGISVVNALSSFLSVEVARDRNIWKQEYSLGKPITKLINVGKAQNRRGTSIEFKPDNKIFDQNIMFKPKTLMEMAKSKAYLSKGIEIRWLCSNKDALFENIPKRKIFCFQNGINDYLYDNN